MSLQYYPSHFEDWDHPDIQVLTLAQRGLLRELAHIQWKIGYIPANRKALLRLLNCGGRELDRAIEACGKFLENREEKLFIKFLDGRVSALRRHSDGTVLASCWHSDGNYGLANSMKTKPIGNTKIKEKKINNNDTAASKNLKVLEATSSSGKDLSDEDLEGVADLVSYWSGNRISADRETCRRILEAWPGTFDEWGSSIKSRCLHLEPSSISSPGWFLALTRSLAKEIDSG